MMGGAAALAVQTGAALMPVILWFEGDHWGVHVHQEIPVPAAGDSKQKAAAMMQEVACLFGGGNQGSSAGLADAAARLRRRPRPRAAAARPGASRREGKSGKVTGVTSRESAGLLICMPRPALLAQLMAARNRRSGVWTHAFLARTVLLAAHA
jgi:Bacterial lipid A biosynthesis acyltransferase